MIVFCQGTYGERLDQTLECIKRVKGHVDRIIIIVDQTVCENDRNRLSVEGAEVHYRYWDDHFPKMRNFYLALCKTNDWIAVSDPDEWFGEEICKDFSALTTECDRRGYTSLLINSHDFWHNNDGSVRSEHKSSFYKKLIFKKLQGCIYNGVGVAGNVHEHLAIPKEVEHAIEDKYFYEHHKMDHEVWERAMRNVFIGGGGNNLGNVNKQWAKLKEICSSLGLERWDQLRAYMRAGNIDTKLKNWLLDNRVEGRDYHHEMLEGFRWYFEYLHPEENTGNWKPIDSQTDEDKIMRFVEDKYQEVLGRHADQDGKEHYTREISEGRIQKHQLDGIFKSSEEYKKRFGK